MPNQEESLAQGTAKTQEQIFDAYVVSGNDMAIDDPELTANSNEKAHGERLTYSEETGSLTIAKKQEAKER